MIYSVNFWSSPHVSHQDQLEHDGVLGWCGDRSTRAVATFTCEGKFFQLAEIAASKRRGKTASLLSPLSLEAVRRVDLLFDMDRGINGKPAAECLAARQEPAAPETDGTRSRKPG